MDGAAEQEDRSAERQPIHSGTGASIMATIGCSRELRKFPSEDFYDLDGRKVHNTSRPHYADSGDSIDDVQDRELPDAVPPDFS